MNDIPGPAVDIPEFLAALMLLQIRGCLVSWRPPAPNALEVYEVGYPWNTDKIRVRLFYADHRGTQQALQLLRERSFEMSPFGLAPLKTEGSMLVYDDVVKTGLEV